MGINKYVAFTINLNENITIMYILLEVSDFQTFCIWWAVHLVMVGVNVSIDNKTALG